MPRIEPVHLDLLAVDDAAWEEALGRFRPYFLPRGEGLYSRPTLCTHTLRIRGRAAKFEGPRMADGEAVLRALTDGQAAHDAFGDEFIIRTRYGLRFRTASSLHEARTSADESHQDQTLAALLEMGISLDHPVRFGSDSLTLRGVLDDAVANYVHRAREVEWTSLALILAVPPRSSWTNRYGQTFTFDDLVEDLVSRDFAQLACGGTHVLYDLVMLYRINAQAAILSAETASQLRQELIVRVQRLQQNQLPDGSWDLLWHLPPEERLCHVNSPINRVVLSRAIATSHLGECMLRLPPELRPPDECIQRCGAWLWDWLSKEVPEAAFLQDYCPYTHAACVVDAIRIKKKR